MTPGPLWQRMLQQPRLSASTITRADIPTSPGVYAWFRDGEPVYVGRAKAKGGLRKRLAGNHLKVGPDLSKSAFRRNVCESIGVADTSITEMPTGPELAEIAIGAAGVARRLGYEPRVALLSFSTFGQPV